MLHPYSPHLFRYIHQQKVINYLPIEQFYCVTADYSMKEKKNFLGWTINVYNRAEEEVSGGVFIAHPINRSLIHFFTQNY